MNTTDLFFAVLRAGLWERDLRLPSAPTEQDWLEVLKTARAQAVVGLLYR
ncbi:MAG: hypothetical protein K5910_01565 [Bacteroidales bacterium]|nr:hypothetical protein [Bacteroidales bacterium]